jgi:hypothetical protein
MAFDSGWYCRDTALRLAAGWAVTETDFVKITHTRRRRPS